MADYILFLHLAILVLVGQHQIYGLDCLKKAGGEVKRVFKGKNTTNCIFVAKPTIRYNDWPAIEKACGYTTQDQLDGYSLRLAVFSYAAVADLREFFKIHRGLNFVGITATATLPYIGANLDQAREMRNLFKWDDGSEVAFQLWGNNQPNNNIVSEDSEDDVVFWADELHDFSMQHHRGSPVCEYYPYKDQAKQPIPACNGVPPRELNKPCRQTFQFRSASHDEAQRICAHAHPVQADHVDTGNQSSVICQYETFAKCNPDEKLIYNSCYKFVAKKETKVNAAKACAKNSKSRLPYIASKSQAKFISEYAEMKGIDSVWIDLDRNGKREKDGKKINGYTRWNPDQITFDTMTCQDPKTEDEFYKKATADAAVLLRTTDYQNALRGFFERADKSFVSSYVCERPAEGTPVIEKWCSLVREMFHYGGSSLGGSYARHYKTVYSFDNCYVRTANFYQRSFDVTKGGWDKCKMLHEEPNNKLIARNAVLYDFQQTSVLRVLSQDPLLIGALRKKQAPKASSCCVAKDQKKRTCMDEADRKEFQLRDPMRVSERELPSLWHSRHPENQCSDFPSGAVGVAFFNGKMYDASALRPMRVLCEYGTRVGAPPPPIPVTPVDVLVIPNNN